MHVKYILTIYHNHIPFFTCEQKKNYDIHQKQRKQEINKKHNSPAGNRTRVFRVTGGDTDHYTTEDVTNVTLRILPLRSIMMILFFYYLKNREFAPTPISNIISYRMRRSKKLIIQGTDNRCCGVTVQKIKIREKNNLSCVHLQQPVKRQACIQVPK